MESEYLLRQDSLLLESPDGVYMRSSGGDLFFKGKSVRPWLVALAPRLAAGCTYEELCAGLDVERSGIVRRIVDQLHAAGLLLLRTREPAGLLPAAVERRFEEQIAFLAHDGEHPRRRFGHWRRSRLLAVGDGPALIAAVLFWLRNGAREIAVAWTGGSELSPAPWERDLGELKQAGVEARVKVFPAATPEAATAILREWAASAVLLTPVSASLGTPPTTSPREAVLRAAEYNGEFTAPLAAAAHRIRCAFVTAGLVGRHLVKGPLVTSAEGPCPGCVRLWFSTHATEMSLQAERITGGDAAECLEVAPDKPGGRNSDESEKGEPQVALYPAVLGALGSELALEIFRHMAGVRAADLERAVVLQDPLTMSGRRESIPAHPRCPDCARPPTVDAALADLRALAAGALDLSPLPQDRYTRYRAALAPTTGLLRRFCDETLPQSTVKVGAVLVAGGEGDSVTGFHVRSVREARCGAVEGAAVRAADREPYLPGALSATRETLAARGETAIAGERLTMPRAAVAWQIALEEGRPIDWVPALRLGDFDDPHLVWVPSAAVLTASEPAAGHGVGADFVEVALGGTLSALLYERLAHWRAGMPDVTERTVLTEEAVREAGSVIVSGLLRCGTLTVTELTTEGPASVVIVRHTSPVGLVHVAAVGLARCDAMRAALVATAGRRQAAEPCDPAGPVPVLARPRPADRAGLDALLTTLRSAGRDALLVATPPVALGGSDAPLRVGRVLLTR